jgi:hypothetical protein
MRGRETTPKCKEGQRIKERKELVDFGFSIKEVDQQTLLLTIENKRFRFKISVL